ncbi:MAG: hypothetical protein G01um101420_208 [Parcubacteria group bacterium Gr01-1014_20]|nr:MAG: hypothetical protein G01um101420_208 [Parcubacteria group bacterium Gr01-1014_20]
MPVIKEIEDFIRKNLQNGKSEEIIKTDLASVGWKEVDISDTLTAVKTATPKEESKKTPDYDVKTPVSQLRFAHLKETIEQYEPLKKEGPKKLPVNLPKKSYLPLILIPTIVAISVGARIYLKNAYPETFTPKTPPPNLDQEILKNLSVTTTSPSSSTPTAEPNPSATQVVPVQKPPSPPKPTSTQPSPTSTPSAPHGGGTN